MQLDDELVGDAIDTLTGLLQQNLTPREWEGVTGLVDTMAAAVRQSDPDMLENARMTIEGDYLEDGRVPVVGPRDRQPAGPSERKARERVVHVLTELRPNRGSGA